MFFTPLLIVRDCVYFHRELFGCISPLQVVVVHLDYTGTSGAQARFKLVLRRAAWNYTVVKDKCPRAISAGDGGPVYRAETPHWYPLWPGYRKKKPSLL